MVTASQYPGDGVTLRKVRLVHFEVQSQTALLAGRTFAGRTTGQREATQVESRASRSCSRHLTFV